MRLLISVCSAVVSVVLASPGQNVIEDRGNGLTAPAIQISESQTLALISRPFHSSTNRRSPELERVARKLERHVNEFIDGWPWVPFHHTLGISGYEAYFHHPDEMFFALSLALPVLSSNTAGKAKVFLAQRLSELPPYSVDGFDNRAGRVREAYDVPSNLRLNGKQKARSAFGVYAFWAYVNATGDAAAASNHWSEIKQRVQPLLGAGYQFDIMKKNYARDEAEALNGNLAALMATVRLAQTNGDPVIERKALERAQQLLELRVNLERVNPRILEPTDSTSKHLHAGKLARFCSLTPEVGEALRTLTDGCGAAHLNDFRESRNAWYLAFVDRMIGGENYTNPLHFSRALFAGAVFVEHMPVEQIASFVDVPWCKGDFYFIEKCALALGAAR